VGALSVPSIDAKPIPLEDLLNTVEGGTAGLPAFQRDYDWSESDVVSLLATLLCDWPAGSLLLMDGRPEFFQVRGFVGGPELRDDLRFVVLDGQQRLTGLFHAIRGTGNSIYVIHAQKLIDSDQSAESVEEAFELVDAAKWRADYPLARQAAERLVPIHELRTASDFFAWRDRVLEASSAHDRAALGKLLADLYRSHLGRLNTYTFPSVILDNRLPPEAVARIFERINRKGLQLNTFDLLVARVYEPGWNLRDKWDEARGESEPISQWLGDDGLPVAQVIGLEKSKDVRQPALLKLSPVDVQSEWNASVAAVEQAVEKVRAIGVPGPAWMPYPGLLLPLAHRAKRLGKKSLERDDLSTWFWARSFGLSYGVGSSTRIASDATLLEERVPDWTLGELAVNRQTLLDATRRQQKAIWAAFISFIASRGVRDLLTGEEIENPLVDAIPVSIFSNGMGDDAVHQRVLGLVLVTRPTARELRRNPATFLDKVVDEARESQLLPAGSLVQALGKPHDFLFARMEELASALEALSQAQVTWGLARFERPSSWTWWSD
jgi:hypothetical protein